MMLQLPLDSRQEKYIRSIGLITPEEEIIEYTKAGEGNMNVVIRLKTQKQNIILKQSRPFVNKFPTIPAPLGRIFIEEEYYGIVNQNGFLADFSPKIISKNKASHLIAMEYLGKGNDFLSLYQSKINLTLAELDQLVKYLLTLHELKTSDFSENIEMKKLNHEHIFVYPFMEFNGFDLNTIQPGLQQMAMGFKTDFKLKQRVKTLGKRYLSSGNNLLHGDFYPGSWMRVESGLKVIDPEFAFQGDREFDLAVLIAHLKMAKIESPIIEKAFAQYSASSTLDLHLLNQYISIEILRRLIGLAQLPLALSLDEKNLLATNAANLIKS